QSFSTEDCGRVGRPLSPHPSPPLVELRRKFALRAPFSSTRRPPAMRTSVLEWLQKACPLAHRRHLSTPLKGPPAPVSLPVDVPACPGPRHRPDPAAEPRRRGIRPRRDDALAGGDRGGERGHRRRRLL